MSEALVGNIVRFADVLRAGGVALHAGRLPDVLAAVESVGVRARPDVRAALRCLLIHRREDLAAFDAAFETFWRPSLPDTAGLPVDALGARPRVSAEPRAGTPLQLETGATAAAVEGSSLVVAAWSDTEALRSRDFATLSPGELARAEALLARMPWQFGERRTRRWTRARVGAIDLRPAVRRNLTHGGELIDLPRRQRQMRPRPVIVLADVSGSMQRYAKMLVQFVHGLSAGAHPVESFVFATRLTRTTRDARGRRGQRAWAALSARVTDWGGGTRIGAALRAFNVRYARRVIRRGPVVLIISDGWDRGDSAQLVRELARLRRSCHRLVWLNPLLGSVSYEPLTRGMLAALPLVDDFLPAHNLVSLEQLAEHLRALDRRHPAGDQRGPRARVPHAD